MRIGILVTSMGNFGQKGFYNAQEIGLARAMDDLADAVKVYKLVPLEDTARTEPIEGCRNAVITFIPAKGFGINGILDTAVLDTNLDALVYFSDTQFSLPRVYRWTRENGVRFLPYIGVLESHSTSRVKKLIVDTLFGRNLRIYRKCRCLVKTPTVGEALRARGVKEVTVTPVGLDLSLMHRDYADSDPAVLKEKYGFDRNDRVILFIGRMIQEKQPLRMIDIFAELAAADADCRLLMVGTGELREAVCEAVKKYGLEDRVKLVDRIPNSQIWELYRLSDAFVNLNQQEIFGMAILEAMYYGCKVVAWHAPGPDLILESGVSGWLVDSNAQAVRKILDPADMSQASHQRITANFTWRNTALRMLEAAREN